MVSINTAQIAFAGIIGGLFSAWIIRIGEQITNFYFSLGFPRDYLPSLRVILDLSIALFFMLIIILMIN
jgi:hypothetical protein